MTKKNGGGNGKVSERLKYTSRDYVLEDLNRKDF